MAINKTERDKIAAALMGADPFHLALGQFVVKFSETEALIQTVFWELASVPTPTDLPLNFHPAAARASADVTPFGAVSVSA